MQADLGVTLIFRKDRQEEMRGFRPSVEDGVMGYLSLGSGAKRFSGVQIAIIARKIAAGNLHTKLMPHLEHLRGGLELHFKAVRLARMQEGWLGQRVPI